MYYITSCSLTSSSLDVMLFPCIQNDDCNLHIAFQVIVIKGWSTRCR